MLFAGDRPTSPVWAELRVGCIITAELPQYIQLQPGQFGSSGRVRSHLHHQRPTAYPGRRACEYWHYFIIQNDIWARFFSLSFLNMSHYFHQYCWYLLLPAVASGKLFFVRTESMFMYCAAVCSIKKKIVEGLHVCMVWFWLKHCAYHVRRYIDLYLWCSVLDGCVVSSESSQVRKKPPSSPLLPVAQTKCFICVFLRTRRCCTLGCMTYISRTTIPSSYRLATTCQLFRAWRQRYHVLWSALLFLFLFFIKSCTLLSLNPCVCFSVSVLPSLSLFQRWTWFTSVCIQETECILCARDDFVNSVICLSTTVFMTLFPIFLLKPLFSTAFVLFLLQLYWKTVYVCFRTWQPLASPSLLTGSGSKPR